MKTYRVYIKGVVQGVFFRKFLKDKAEELSLKGFVRNLKDGRVELVIEGKDEKVGEMIDICKKGPQHSKVENVNYEEIHHQGFKDFKISRL